MLENVSYDLGIPRICSFSPVNLGLAPVRLDDPLMLRYAHEPKSVLQTQMFPGYIAAMIGHDKLPSSPVRSVPSN